MLAHKLNLVSLQTRDGKRPIELVTDNGFTVVRSCDLDRPPAPEPGKYCFIVRDPNDYELEITVQVGHIAMHEILARGHARISLDSDYWSALAERHLADYLWEQGDYPPDGYLVVTQLSPVDCDLALRWKSK